MKSNTQRERKPSSISILLNYAGGHRALTLTGCCLSGVAAVLSILPYICVWLVIKEVFGTPVADNLSKYGWMAVAFAALSILVYFSALMCTHLAAFRTARNMRQAAIAHLVTLPMGFFSQNQSGKLRKIVDDNAGMTESLLAHQLPDLVGAIVTPISAIVLLFIFDWRMGLISLIPMALSVWLMTLMMGGKNVNFFARYQVALEEMSGEAVEYVRGIPVVKVFQQTVHSFKSFYRAIMSYRQLASDYAMSCRTPMTGFTTALNGTFLLLLPFGMLLAVSSGNGWDTLLNLIFYIMFTPVCAGMMNKIMYSTEALMQADEAVRKLDRIMSQKPLSEPDHPAAPNGHSIEFKNVSFSYPGNDTEALHDVCFNVPERSTIALVGPSGGGKTTAACLIPRFWDAGAGQILIGGTDVRKIGTEQLMDMMAFVFQDTHLFKQSLLDNIRAARPDASRDEVLNAAHSAQCDDILVKLPYGIDTVVGTKGVFLSGGEQQRIALARAILKDAPIIILDEASAFADPENEYQIQKALVSLTKDKTVLMIAHRLTTIQNADHIVVLNKGKVQEQGSHKELLSHGGLYADMWNDYQKSAQWKIGKEADK